MKGVEEAKTGHGKKDTSIRKSQNRKSFKCYHCNKLGHMKKECKLWKREQDERKKKMRKRLIQLPLKVMLSLFVIIVMLALYARRVIG